MQPLLEPIARSLNYADLPETWRVPKIGRFSVKKTLYDYQTDALEKAARALYFYWGKDHKWDANKESKDANDECKRSFATLYQHYDSLFASLVPKRYVSRTDEKNQKQNQVFRILSDFITPQGDLIPYYKFINRMCFWMVTDSGKTLVMVKLIEYLHSLKKHGEILPPSAKLMATGSCLKRMKLPAFSTTAKPRFRSGF